jgi:hypothetical protein
MAFRFRRSIKIAPGIKLNLGKTGGSFSFGCRGSTVTIGRGGTFANVGIPGTGLSWRTKVNGGGKTAKTFTGATGGTAAQRKALNIATLQKEALAYNEAAEEGINQHKKIPIFPGNIEWRDIKKIITSYVPYGSFLSTLLCIFFFYLSVTVFLNYQKSGNDNTVAFGAMLFIGIFVVKNAYFLFKRWRVFSTQKSNFKKSRSGDTKAAENLLSFALHDLDWFLETIPDFEFSQNGKHIYIDVDLPEIEDMPDCRLIVKKGEQAMYKKFKEPDEIAKDYSTHVHGIVMRIAGLCFYIFPSVEKVLCSGYTQRTNVQTGIVQDDYVLSVIFDRAMWQKTNPAQAVPESFVTEFPMRREIDTGKILKKIEPFSPNDI